MLSTWIARRVLHEWLGSLLQVRCVVLDAIFVGLSILFFVVAFGYVAVCDRLMK